MQGGVSFFACATLAERPESTSDAQYSKRQNLETEFVPCKTTGVQGAINTHTVEDHPTLFGFGLKGYLRGVTLDLGFSRLAMG